MGLIKKKLVLMNSLLLLIRRVFNFEVERAEFLSYLDRHQFNQNIKHPDLSDTKSQVGVKFLLFLLLWKKYIGTENHKIIFE